MKIWQANLGRGVSAAEFEENLLRILKAAGPRAIIVFQEIDEADSPEEFEILVRLTKDTHRIYGGDTAVPILVPVHLEVIEDLQTIACKGLAKYTPHRVLNEVVIRLRSGRPVVIFNVHLPLNRPATFTRRREVRKALRRRARARRGMAGVWLADTNTRIGWPRIVKGERSVVAAGIDRAKAWPSKGRKVVVTGRQTINLTIDGHDAHGAKVQFPRRAKTH